VTEKETDDDDKEDEDENEEKRREEKRREEKRRQRPEDLLKVIRSPSFLFFDFLLMRFCKQATISVFF
jgi:hypothetical protein